MAGVLLAAASSHAQSPPHWRSFTSLDGLPESWVADVTIGPSGRVFVMHGDVSTMSVYDGMHFTRLPSPGPSVTVREGPDGRLWALHRVSQQLVGIQTLDGETWTATTLAALTPFAAKPRDFLPWAPDRVLIVTPRAIVEFLRATGSVRELFTARALGVGDFLACEGRRDGGAWIVASGGVVRVTPDGQPPVILPAPSWAAGAASAWISEGTGGALHLVLRRPTGGARSQSAVRIDGEQWTLLASDDNAQFDWAAAWQGADDEWWLATAHVSGFALTSHRDRQATRVPPARMLSGQLLAVTPAPDGGVWLGTALGLVRHTPAAWRPVAGPDGQEAVGPLVQTARGDIVAVQATRLLHTPDGERWHGHPFPQALPAGAVYQTALLVDRNGAELACRTEGGLLTLDLERDALALTPVDIPGATSFTVVGKTRDGGVWLLVNPRGARTWVESYGGRTNRRIESESGWQSVLPREVVETAAGDVFVVPDGNGVGRWRDGRFEHFGPDHGYPGSGAFCAAEVAPGRIWFGDRNSVIEFDGSSWRTVRDGLETVRAIVPGRDGSVWVTSGTGLHRFHEGSWLTMTAADGLPDGAMADVLQDRQGRVWASSLAGLSRHHADADRDPPDTWLAATNPREVPPSGDAQFVFSGADRWVQTRPQRLLYSWRVDDGAWTPFSTENTARAPGLRAGRHVFAVRAMDRDGNVDPSPASLDFEVMRPWYLATGFLLLGLPGLLLLGTGAGLLFTRHLRLERMVEDRTAALQEAHRQILKEAAERQQAEARFRQAQKMEALGRLAGGVAHDFNNMLTVISGYTELLRDDPATNGPQRVALGEIARAADSAKSLTKRLLAFGRHQVTRLEVVDLNGVVQDASRMLERLLGEHVTLDFTPTEGLWLVAADRGQMEQVVINLAVNARDAMAAGGRIGVTLENTELDAAFCLRHDGISPGQYVRIAVSDDGAGMDAATLDRIFEPFFTTKEPGKGTGLGLSLVYGISRQSGGCVDVQSQVGKGTTLMVYLPRWDAEPEPAPGEAPPVDPAPLRGAETVLVVEDAAAVREFAVASLRRFGYHVLSAESAEAAEACFEGAGIHIDLLLTDIVMTGRSGPELATRLKRRTPALRVVFMSGYADASIVGQALRDGDVAFVQKPFTAAVLAAKVREALDAPV